MSKLPRPLLRRSRQYPGEVPLSLAIRLTKLNHYHTLGIIVSLCLDRPVFDHTALNCLSRPEAFNRLAQLTKIPVFDLYQSSPHVFAEILMPPDREIQKIQLSDGTEVPLLDQRAKATQLRSARCAQYCPGCITEQAYHRLIWMPLAVTACLRHRCLLVDHCQQCQSKLGITDIVEDTCKNCGFDLRNAHASSLDNDELGLLSQEIIQSWLQKRPFLEIGESALLPDEPARALYRFMDGLRHIIASTPNWNYPQHTLGDDGSVLIPRERSADHLTTRVAHVIYRTAFKALTNWPEGFFEFLREYINHNYKSGRRQYFGLHNLYERWISAKWEGEEFQFVRTAFDYFVKVSDSRIISHTGQERICRKRLSLIDEDTFVTHTEAAEILKVHPKTIDRLVQNGCLSSYDGSPWFSILGGKSDTLNTQNTSDSKKGNYPHFRLLNHDEVWKLADRWNSSLSLESTARIMGISNDVVIDLVELGVITAERGPDLDGSSWLFSETVVRDFGARVLGFCTYLRDSGYDNKVDLTKAAQKLSAIGLNMAQILKRVGDGDMRCYVLPQPSNFCDLRFDPHAIDEYVELVLVDRGWIRQKHIAKRMGVKVGTVSKWVKAGLIKPAETYGTAQYFTQHDLDRFAADHVFTNEAADILDVGSLVVQKWARNGRLKPISGPGIDNCHSYLFCRKDLDELCPENRLSATQMAKRMGVSRSQLNERIRQGKITPISGPGIDGSGQYLFLNNRGSVHQIMANRSSGEQV